MIPRHDFSPYDEVCRRCFKTRLEIEQTTLGFACVSDADIASRKRALKRLEVKFMKGLIVGLFCLLPLAAHAAEVTPALIRACQGDARRLCGQQIRAHDIPAVRICMIGAADRISRRCTIAWQASRGG